MSPCRVVKMPDGSTAIVCSRGRSSGTPCYVCGRPSSYLCDYPVTRGGKPATCDKPMCARCRNNVGPDRDYCNAHFRLWKEEAL